MKPIDMWYLGLVVKRLRCINCVNPCATISATFSNQKLGCVIVFLLKNDETKNSSYLQLKA